jgi:hypothetical protein
MEANLPYPELPYIVVLGIGKGKLASEKETSVKFPGNFLDTTGSPMP